MQALAHYVELRTEGRREFKLLSDHIDIHGKEYLGAEYEMSISLADLQPQPDTFRCRPKMFSTGVWLTIVPSGLALTLVTGFGQSHLVGLPPILWALTLCGLFILLSSLGRETHVAFKTIAGTYGLTIVKSGKDQRRFDEFVGAVRRGIEVVRNSKQEAPPNGGPVTRIRNSGVTEGLPSVS